MHIVCQNLVRHGDILYDDPGCWPSQSMKRGKGFHIDSVHDS